MKITSVDVMMFPSEKPQFSNPCPVICRVNTDEGIYGYGEAGTTFFTGSGAVAELIRDMSKMILGMNPTGDGKQVVEAEVPMSTIFRYCTDLRSMTGGSGEYSYEFARYEQCPSDIQEKEVAARAAKVAENSVDE